MTLQFKADWNAASDWCDDFLLAASESKNKELFRSEVKHLIDFKWDKLRR